MTIIPVKRSRRPASPVPTATRDHHGASAELNGPGRRMPRRVLVGKALSNDQMGETLLSKTLALPVFCSDPISSVAYATEEILLVLGLAGTALLTLTWPVALAVSALLVIVVASYRQTVHAYPNGGGAYAVSRENLGSSAALIAACALLVDYVLTVAVSIVAGIANLSSAFPWVGRHAVMISVLAVVLLTVMNLRGVKESGTAFAVPTYGFVVSILFMVGAGLVETVLGHPVTAESAAYSLQPVVTVSGLTLLALVLRAFASGCTALTGVEAISNGVPNFRRPKSRNASTTLAVMGGLAVTMFLGVTALAMIAHVHMAADPTQLGGAPAGYEQRTVIAQLAQAVFGGSLGFYVVQGFTVAILVLAANTAFNGFPILASILGGDGYLPRQLSRRGDRLVFSNGIVILATLASGLIVAFDASTSRLIQLYIIGVFVSFTLSQLGMVRHWSRRLAVIGASRERSGVRRRQAVNAIGAAATAVVLMIVLATKFTHGAWLVVIAMPLLFAVMKLIRQHYVRTDARLVAPPGGVTLPSRVHAVVLVSRLNAPTVQALAYARATRPNSIVALHVMAGRTDIDQLTDEWTRRQIPVPLVMLESPYRDITTPVVEYVRRVRRESPRDLVAVHVPEYVVAHWWEHFLHNQSALRIKTRLLFEPGVTMTSVPWYLGDQMTQTPEEGQPVPKVR
ncbi:MAG: APC family permease [Actinomycetes bacterium]